MRNHFSDYLEEKADLMTFFAGPPKSVITAAPKAAHWDPALVEALTEYMTRLGGRPLFMGDEAVVATGQQAGLLTGPLYTIYKAITAILLAKKVHDRVGARCVPVFWVAGDDHDFEEVQTTWLLNKNNELTELKYVPQDNVDGLPIYRVPLDASLHQLVDRAASEASGSEFRNEVATFLHESLDSAGSFADWMARIMARLFRETPLIVFVPHLQTARDLASPILDREIRDPLVSTMLLNDCGKRLQELDFPQQVTKGETECNFFLEMGGRRRKVLFEDDRYVIPEEGMTCSVDEMAGMLKATPDRFNANVALRCVVQQHLFPVAAYVAGPGEVAYWAQLKPLFRHFGKEMPVVYPRARCVIKNTKLSQIMEKFEFSMKDVAGPPEELMERALQAASRAPSRDVVQKHRDPILSALHALTTELEPVNKTASGMAQKIEERMTEEIDRLETAILKDDEAQAAAIRKQVMRLCATFFPSRKPQERILNVFSFLFEYGWDLIPRLIKEVDIDTFAVKEIEL